MERKYLNDDQQRQLEAMLMNQEAAPEGQPSPGAQPPVEDMAGGAAPAEPAAPVDSGAAPASAPEDPMASVLAELGVSSVEELVERYKERDAKATEFKDMLAQLLAYQQSLDNTEELDNTSDPMNSVKRAVREEMKPLYDKLQAETRNKLVQEAWSRDAELLPDIADVMPEITEFIAAHPDLAVENDGLRRAYEGVRSKKYTTEAQMLADDDFVKRMASNEKIKNAVLEAHLGELARNGEGVPASIGKGGETPLTGQKQAPSSMQQAKSGLAKMLGLK